MAQSTKWAVGIGLVVVCLGIGGASFWQQRHPNGSAIASLTDALPTPSAPSQPAPLSPSAAPAVPEPPAPAPEAAAQMPPATVAPEAPHFDVVRVEPKGDTVVAGKGEPNAKVALLASGKVVAEAKADPSGQFVLLPPPLPPGDYALTLRQSPDGKPANASSQSVTVSVPKAPGGDVVVALAEPGKPTKLLSTPTAPKPVVSTAMEAPVAAAANRKLSIGAVDLENGTGFHATGSAVPGTSVHVYLNDTHLADVTANKDGSWSVTIRKGLAAGRYAVRADAAGAGAGVSARAEVPFDVPVTMAVLPPATMVSPGDSRAVGGRPNAPIEEAGIETAGSGPDTMETAKALPGETAPSGSREATNAQPDASAAVIDQVVTHQVSNGDNLWTISRRSFGDGRRFTQIYEANATQIRDPNLIYPGQIFVLPAKR